MELGNSVERGSVGVWACLKMEVANDCGTMNKKPWDCDDHLDAKFGDDNLLLK